MTNEIKEATGKVERLNQRSGGYGFVLDNDNEKWYNGFGTCPYENGETVTVRYKDEYSEKYGKTFHNVISENGKATAPGRELPKGERAAKPEVKDAKAKLKEELEKHGDPGDFVGANELSGLDRIVGEGGLLLRKCYSQVEYILGHRPEGREVALVNTLFIFETKHQAAERWLRSKDKNSGIEEFM